MPNTFTITFGGWYQRTTLHLSELYEFLIKGESKLDLKPEKLKANWRSLGIKEVSREIGYLEYVLAKVVNNIDIKYYEDGLYTFSVESDNPVTAHETIQKYYDEFFNPAVSYIFSLGAPTPKVLANIKTSHPLVISLAYDKPGAYKVEEEKYGLVYSKISYEDLCVQKTPNYIFITYKAGLEQACDAIIDMQIFFREFKDHLEKYLNIHRKIWEEITEIKETRYIRGKDVESTRSRLDSYQKTISLISNRINQMGSYSKTRQSIAKSLGVEKNLLDLFNYKFETLFDTLEYIKEIWKMTTEYVNSAIQVLTDIRALTTNRTIQSLTLITTIGVAAGLIGHLGRDAFPPVKTFGLFYLAGLFAFGAGLNAVLTKIYQNRKYKLKITQHEKNL